MQSDALTVKRPYGWGRDPWSVRDRADLGGAVRELAEVVDIGAHWLPSA